MFDLIEDNPPYLEQNSCRFTQFYSRGGHEPNAIVLHTTGSSTKAAEIARNITVRWTSRSWHYLVDKEQCLNLLDVKQSACSIGLSSNRTTVNVAISLCDRDWAHLVARSRSAERVYSLAWACAKASRDIQKAYGYQIPARLITKEQYHNGEKGILAHKDIDPESGCFNNWFPWTDFLNFYDQLNSPKPLSVAVVAAESAAVAINPGAIASYLLKSPSDYQTVGEILLNAMPDQATIRNVFYRYTGRQPRDHEAKRLDQCLKDHGIHHVVQLMVENLQPQSPKPSTIDLKLLQIQSSGDTGRIGVGGNPDAMDTR